MTTTTTNTFAIPAYRPEGELVPMVKSLGARMPARLNPSDSNAAQLKRADAARRQRESRAAKVEATIDAARQLLNIALSMLELEAHEPKGRDKSLEFLPLLAMSDKERELWAIGKIGTLRGESEEYLDSIAGRYLGMLPKGKATYQIKQEISFSKLIRDLDTWASMPTSAPRVSRSEGRLVPRHTFGGFATSDKVVRGVELNPLGSTFVNGRQVSSGKPDSAIFETVKVKIPYLTEKGERKERKARRYTMRANLPIAPYSLLNPIPEAKKRASHGPNTCYQALAAYSGHSTPKTLAQKIDTAMGIGLKREGAARKSAEVLYGNKSAEPHKVRTGNPWVASVRLSVWIAAHGGFSGKPKAMAV